MKVAPLYIFFIVIILMQGCRDNTDIRRNPDQRITLRKSDKIPYGCYVAYNSLKYLFPSADISSDRSVPGLWDSISSFENKQALLIITRRFSANEYEMEKLIEFVKGGNHVFISAREFSVTAQDAMGLRASGSFTSFEQSDTLELLLLKPPFQQFVSNKYPGKKFDTYLFKFDSSITAVLGTSFDHEPNYIRLKAGDGYLYLHMAPLAFSNYFLLHKRNIHYYNNILSVLPSDLNRVVWDEYFISKGFEPAPRRRGGFLSGLLKEKNLRAAFWILLGMAVVYVLMEMRRKQRVIPMISRPANDSLDFVKTIGRLYYDKKDHHNLCRKMSAYFLEHVRNKYKLGTAVLDGEFVKSLHLKSGYPEQNIRGIVDFIGYLDLGTDVSDIQLNSFYKQLESFYKNT